MSEPRDAMKDVHMPKVPAQVHASRLESIGQSIAVGHNAIDQLAQYRTGIENAIRMMSGDPDGKIPWEDWSKVDEILQSYAVQFDASVDATAELSRIRELLGLPENGDVVAEIERIGSLKEWMQKFSPDQDTAGGLLKLSDELLGLRKRNAELEAELAKYRGTT